MGAHEFIRSIARARRGFPVPGAPAWMGSGPMGTLEALAFEIALNHEDERRAMSGQLAILEAPWRDAERIAAIADRLPDDPPATA